MGGPRRHHAAGDIRIGGCKSPCSLECVLAGEDQQSSEGSVTNGPAEQKLIPSAGNGSHFNLHPRVPELLHLGGVGAVVRHQGPGQSQPRPRVEEPEPEL